MWRRRQRSRRLATSCGAAAGVHPAGLPTGGLLVPDDVLVSNFNNSANLQGTGTTIVSIDSSGQQRLFFEGHHLLGFVAVVPLGWPRRLALLAGA